MKSRCPVMTNQLPPLTRWANCFHPLGCSLTLLGVPPGSTNTESIDCQRAIHHALGRVRTRLPVAAKDGSISKVVQSWGLSRLRKYRVGNCTFVTFGREGNQPRSRSAATGMHSLRCQL